MTKFCYSILSSSGNFPENASTDIYTWKIGTQVIAKFFAFDKSPSKFFMKFGETSEALWVIQGEIRKINDFSIASEKEIINTAVHDPAMFGRLFWGNYLLITYEKKFRKFTALSDPCGQSPVFFMEGCRGDIHIGHNVEDFSRIGQFDLTPDEAYLSCFAWHGTGIPGSTGVKNLHQLPPHQMLVKRTREPISLERFWSPLRWNNGSAREDPIRLLTRILYATLRDSREIFLELSGGLESTCLAIALFRSGLSDKVTAVTHYDRQRASSNEVAIAAQVARRCNMKHKAHSLTQVLPFSPYANPPCVAKPATQLCFLGHAADLMNNVFPGVESVLLNGHGGDALFLAPPPFGVPVDALSRMRFVRSAKALFHLAIAYRMPLQEALKQTVRAAKNPYGANLSQPFSSEIMQITMMPRPISGYDDLIRDWSLILRPAKRFQLAMLWATIDETMVQARLTNNRPFLPFLSQPLVEMAMRFPPEDPFSAEHNRMPIRRSAYDACNLSNIWRPDKGDTTHVALKGLKRNVSHVREICLEGWCASQGMLHRASIARIINRLEMGYSSGLVEITRIFAIETFLHGIGNCRPNRLTGSHGR